MKKLLAFLQSTLLLMVLLSSSSCADASTYIDLVGSTPGDESVKSILSISPEIKIDFIRWDLKLDEKNAFILDITYGESQPNTLGFKGDGQRKTIRGTYSIAKKQHCRFKEMYELKSDEFNETVSLAKINENVFHILTSYKQLMVGNGGWSYSLNRKVPVDADEILISPLASDDQSLHIIFDGRTPCREFLREHPEMNASQSCFKLKWKLTLNRDSVTRRPTTCIVRSIVDNQSRDLSGKWEIIRGTSANPDAIIYKISVPNLNEPILLLASDENVLFFLDRNATPFTGNENFSFALNRRI